LVTDKVIRRFEKAFFDHIGRGPSVFGVDQLSGSFKGSRIESINSSRRLKDQQSHGGSVISSRRDSMISKNALSSKSKRKNLTPNKQQKPSSQKSIDI